eukprot:scaffold2319_cov248-Pinguiococcus_pyrenoidosus.AAC.3
MAPPTPGRSLVCLLPSNGRLGKLEFDIPFPDALGRQREAFPVGEKVVLLSTIVLTSSTWSLRILYPSTFNVKAIAELFGYVAVRVIRTIRVRNDHIIDSYDYFITPAVEVLVLVPLQRLRETISYVVLCTDMLDFDDAS